MGKSRSSNLVNIMVGDMTCVCWCTTQSSLLRENPWGNGRRYGVVIVRCGVCDFGTKMLPIQIFLYIVLFQYSHLSITCPISVDRVGNFGDSDVLLDSYRFLHYNY